jgi:starvation-inducible DNA-binding protein
MARRIGVPIEELARQTAAGHLQTLLVDLIGLGLNGKQLHWHLTGPIFLPVHAQLDEIVDATRDYADRLAERSVTLGMPVDGRPSTIGKDSQIGELEPGWIDAIYAVDAYAEQLAAVVQRARIAVDQLDEEKVTQDLVITMLHDLEKLLWMLQAQVAGQ